MEDLRTTLITNQTKREAGYSIHIAYIVISLIWYYFITSYTTNPIDYGGESCQLLLHYMRGLGSFYYWLAVFSALVLVLEIIFIGKRNAGESITTMLGYALHVGLGLLSVYYIIVVTYAYSQGEQCDSLGVVATVWLILIWGGILLSCCGVCIGLCCGLAVLTSSSRSSRH